MTYRIPTLEKLAHGRKCWMGIPFGIRYEHNGRGEGLERSSALGVPIHPVTKRVILRDVILLQLDDPLGPRPWNGLELLWGGQGNSHLHAL